MRHTSTVNSQPTLPKKAAGLKPMTIGKSKTIKALDKEFENPRGTDQAVNSNRNEISPESPASINNEARIISNELIDTMHTVMPRVSALSRQVSQELPIATFVTPPSDKGALNVD